MNSPDTTIKLQYGSGSDSMKAEFSSEQNGRVTELYLFKQYQLLLAEREAWQQWQQWQYEMEMMELEREENVSLAQMLF